MLLPRTAIVPRFNDSSFQLLTRTRRVAPGPVCSRSAATFRNLRRRCCTRCCAAPLCRTAQLELSRLALAAPFCLRRSRGCPSSDQPAIPLRRGPHRRRMTTCYRCRLCRHFVTSRSGYHHPVHRGLRYHAPGVFRILIIVNIRNPLGRLSHTRMSFSLPLSKSINHTPVSYIIYSLPTRLRLARVVTGNRRFVGPVTASTLALFLKRIFIKKQYNKKPFI